MKTMTDKVHDLQKTPQKDIKHLLSGDLSEKKFVSSTPDNHKKLYGSHIKSTPFMQGFRKK